MSAATATLSQAAAQISHAHGRAWLSAVLIYTQMHVDDGRMLFIEHGRSDKTGVAKWQDRWNPVQKVVGCGCNVNRKMDALIEEAGFTFERLDRFIADGAPEVFGTMYRGAARHG